MATKPRKKPAKPAKKGRVEALHATLRDEYLAGASMADLSRRYHCCWKSVHRAVIDLKAQREALLGQAQALSDEKIVEMHRAGHAIVEITIELCRSRATVVRVLAAHGIHTDNAPKTKTAQRPCMCCGTQFNSDGNHNRMCSTCRTQSRGATVHRMPYLDGRP